MFCHKLGAFAKFSRPRKEGKYWKGSLVETFRMIFSLYPGVTPPISTRSFYVYVIIWWLYRTDSSWKFWLPKGAGITVKQPSMLLN